MVSPYYLIPTMPNAELCPYMENYKHVNVYVDVKNAMQTLFIHDVGQEMIEMSRGTDHLCSLIFQSLIYYIAYWKRFLYKQNKTATFYLCMDHGQSVYHHQIYKKYKSNRNISNKDPFLASYEQELNEIRAKNFVLAERVLNRIPNVYVFDLPFLESDYLPHFLIHHVNKKQVDSLNILISNDKDHFQTLRTDNVLMFCKKTIKGTKINYILNNKNIFEHYAGLYKMEIKQKTKYLDIINKAKEDFSPSIMDVTLAITGDAGDFVPGIKGLGNLTVMSHILSEPELLKSLLGTRTEMLERVCKYKGDLLPKDKLEKAPINKKWQTLFLDENVKTLNQAFKLVSYDALIYDLYNDDTNKSTKLQWTDYINKRLCKERISLLENEKTLVESFKIGIKDNQLNESIIEQCYL